MGPEYLFATKSNNLIMINIIAIRMIEWRTIDSLK